MKTSIINDIKEKKVFLFNEAPTKAADNKFKIRNLKLKAQEGVRNECNNNEYTKDEIV